jgi:hypothetical protein
MLGQLENAKMIKVLPKGFLCFQEMNTVKVMNLLMLMKTPWEVHLIKKHVPKKSSANKA